MRNLLSTYIRPLDRWTRYLWVLLAGCLAAPIQAQHLVQAQPLNRAQHYSVSGTVFDEQGTPVQGAELVLIEPSAGSGPASPVPFMRESAVTETDHRGRYALPALPPGVYTVAVFRPGKEVNTRAFVLVDRDLELDIVLQDLKKELDEITVAGENQTAFGIQRLRAVEVDALYGAKKNEVVVLRNVTANLATNNSRQMYARVPGLNIWESDGAGVQLGIGGRGLSPNRNSNFNTRQNGYDIAADALGYPESYYTPPAQALERIEIIRGAASLQYGTQFGGLLNFVFKEGAEQKPLAFTSHQTVGSFGLFNSFNSLGGSSSRARYYGFYQYKTSKGWRPNEELTHHTAYASAQFEVSDRWTVKPEFTYMTYLAHQPGGLTDAQFERDPRQSNRERNWFNVDWTLWALASNYTFSPRTRLNTRFFGLFAGRDALGNLDRIDRSDFGGERDLLSDTFRNWGNETRVIHRYSFLQSLSVMLVGARYYDGFTHRQQGKGPDGDDPDFRYTSPYRLEGSDFDLPNKNVSLFAENIFNLSPRLSLVPGIRYEFIRTEAEGYYRNTVQDLAGNLLLDETIEENRESTRSFAFFGLGMSYTHNETLEAYANFSQNYRAINFNDIRVNIGSLEVDPDIQDERGYNVELGARGSGGDLLNYDVSLFHLSYRDRIGTVLRSEPNPQFNNLVDRLFRYRTNIADAQIYGVETYAEVDLYKLLVDRSSRMRVTAFGNVALIRAEYSKSGENGIEGNAVELVPRTNVKAGITVQRDRLRMAYQFTYVSEQFSDASNAIRTPTAIEGVIPSYRVMDVSLQYRLGRYQIDAGVNNLTDTIYFTRRATGYPGPGIIPSNGRSFYLTAGLRI